MAQRVDLDAMIPREDFGVMEESFALAARTEMLLRTHLEEFYDFTDHWEKVRYAQELKPRLEPEIRRAVMRGELDPQDVGEFVRSWLRSESRQ